MVKKLFLTPVLLLLLVSCAKVEIVSDPYWEILVEEFQTRTGSLKIQAALNGTVLVRRVVEKYNGKFNLSDRLSEGAEVYLFSPLLSRSVTFSDLPDSGSVYYLFENNSLSGSDKDHSVFTINYDRKSSFTEAGRIVSGKTWFNGRIPVIFDNSDLRTASETESFLSALRLNGNNPEIIKFEIDLSTSEDDIKDFFNNKNVAESDYIVIFTDKWKKICYDLSVRDDKKIITSDFWFNRSYKSNIVLSVENDMKGLLKKVYKNIKKGDHRDVSLNGVIR